MSEELVGLARLIQMVPPPVAAAEAPQGDGAHGGLVLPRDYVRLIEVYRDGVLTDGQYNQLQVLTPPWVDGGRMLSWTEAMTEINQTNLRGDDFSARVARKRWVYEHWPQPGGLLAWGDFNERVTLWWETVGEPDDWITVAEDSENMRMIELPYPATEVILRLIDGSIDDALLGEQWAAPVRFVPWPR